MKKTARMNGWWLLLLAAAAGGCDSGVVSPHPKMGTGGDGGMGGSAESCSSTSSSSSGTTTSSSTTSGAGGDGGTGMSDCTALKLAQCAQMKLCAPHLYAQRWENDDALCQSEAVRLCSSLPSALDGTVPGVVDPAACADALEGSCDAYLAAVDIPPAACQPNPGTKTIDESCVTAAQCGAGLSCYPGGPPSCPSYCGPVAEAGDACGISSLSGAEVCDPYAGLSCVYDLAQGGDACTAIHRGAAGAACVGAPPGKSMDEPSAEQCQSGFACTPKLTCKALLQEGASCYPGLLGDNPLDPCDHRLGLSCQPVDTAHPLMGSTCQPPYVVPDGATCGMVLDGTVTHDHVCGDYSYCNCAGVCVHDAMAGEGCEANGCYPPYVCSMGTCQAPAVQADPPCDPVTMAPVAELECGLTPGGLPLICAAGTACCMRPTFVPICSTGSSCAATDEGEVDCDDSSQCTGGELCCLQYNPSPTNNIPLAPPVKAVCSAASSCTGFHAEICRADGSNPCNGGTCAQDPNINLIFNGNLPPNTGFCGSAPVCQAPGDGAHGPAVCCSNSYNAKYETCN